VDESKNIRDIVKKAYDLHFHIGPDILPRRFNVEDLVKEETGKIRGIALKAHSFPTMTYITESQHDQKDITLIGSITLNYFMGGFNPSAIYASAMMSKEMPIIVWFPTIHAENHLINNKSEYEIPPEWVKDPSFKPRPKTDLKAIKVTNWANRPIRKANLVLDVIQEMGCILATGHINWQEAERISLEALDRGIRVIVTHPLQKDIAMPIGVQKKLADKGAFIEYCYIMYLDRDNTNDYPLEKQAEYIKDIGIDQCVLTSDGGQIGNPSSSQCMTEMIKLLSEHEISLNDLKKMVVDNPGKILGL